jgi:hypothetical protein
MAWATGTIAAKGLTFNLFITIALFSSQNKNSAYLLVYYTFNIWRFVTRNFISEEKDTVINARLS